MLPVFRGSTLRKVRGNALYRSIFMKICVKIIKSECITNGVMSGLREVPTRLLRSGRVIAYQSWKENQFWNLFKRPSPEIQLASHSYNPTTLQSAYSQPSTLQVRRPRHFYYSYKFWYFRYSPQSLSTVAYGFSIRYSVSIPWLDPDASSL